MNEPFISFHSMEDIGDNQISDIVIATQFQGKWVMCPQENRTTWEMPCGSKSANESSLQAAQRILLERTGAATADIKIISVYQTERYGLLAFAQLLGGRLDNAKTRLYETTPDQRICGSFHTQLFGRVQGWLNMQSNPDELWDIYDCQRNPTGRLHRRGDALPEGEYHIVVHVWVRNSNGNFLLTKRCPTKSFPNMWECSCGSAQAGDDSLSAALREVWEETGLALSPENGERIFSFLRKDCFLDVWLFQQEFDVNAVKLLEGETCDVRSATFSEVKHLYQIGLLVPFSYFDSLEEKFSDIS